MEWLSDPQAWVALVTLTALEIVLGIDNIIFISILVGRLPEHQRQRARVIGLGLAMFTRILLLLSLAWVMSLTTPWFTIFGEEISGRDFILLGGRLFLLAKSTHEIHNSLEGAGEDEHKAPLTANFFSILIQIAVIDIVFSLDSVITAVGMADHVPVMVIAIVIAVGVMMFAAKAIGEFVDTCPTIEVRALCFLIPVVAARIGEGLDFHIPKGYIYLATAFSVVAESPNPRLRKKRQEVR